MVAFLELALKVGNSDFRNLNAKFISGNQNLSNSGFGFLKTFLSHYSFSNQVPFYSEFHTGTCREQGLKVVQGKFK